MGKRFGRNQKRKLRAALAVALENEQSARLLEDDERSKRRSVEARYGNLEHRVHLWEQRILDVLGPASAFARVMQKHQLAYPIDASTPVRLRTKGPHYMTGAIVEAFATYVRANIDDVSGRVRAELISPKGRSAIAMDLRSFLMGGLDEEALIVLGRDLIEQLAGHLHAELGIRR